MYYKKKKIGDFYLQQGNKILRVYFMQRIYYKSQIGKLFKLDKWEGYTAPKIYLGCMGYEDKKGVIQEDEKTRVHFNLENNNRVPDNSSDFYNALHNDQLFTNYEQFVREFDFELERIYGVHLSDMNVVLERYSRPLNL